MDKHIHMTQSASTYTRESERPSVSVYTCTCIPSIFLYKHLFTSTNQFTSTHTGGSAVCVSVLVMHACVWSLCIHVCHMTTVLAAINNHLMHSFFVLLNLEGFVSEGKHPCTCEVMMMEYLCRRIVVLRILRQQATELQQ